MAFAHSSQAFEHALLDAMIRLNAGESQNILLGGFDEITDNQFILNDRLKRWRKNGLNSLELFHDPEQGTIAGEGFTFFFLQDRSTEKTYAEIKDVMAIFSTENTDIISEKAYNFLEKNGLEPGMTDWVFTGINGDREGDAVYQEVLSRLFPSGINQAAWKHLSGEYLTSTAFATWTAAKALKHQAVPGVLRIKTMDNRQTIKNILVYNHFKGIHHSFILLSSAD
jgi:hypothetical protein